MKEYRILNREETERFGLALAKLLVPGSIIALSGDLGAGKTTLTQAIARGLGINTPVTSPTFLLLQEYQEGRMPLYHFDLYRLGEEADLFELGFEEYLYGDGVSIVEWADLVSSQLPKNIVSIQILFGESELERIYRMEGGTEVLY